MIRSAETTLGWRRDGLRTRYRPRTQIRGKLFAAAPWLNLLILLAAFGLLVPRLVLPPGRSIELPDGTVSPQGTRSVTAVVLSHRESTASEARAEMIFFEDQPFAVDNPAQMQELKTRFFRVAREHPETVLVVEADVHVEYGTIARLCTVASRTGFKTVHLAGRLPGEHARE